MNKQWYYKARNGWYIFVEVDGKRTKRRMGDTESEAYENWRKELARAEKAIELGPTFNELSAVFSGWAATQVRNGDLSIETVQGYAFFADRFAEFTKDLQVGELAPRHLTDWIASYPSWGPSSQRHAITAIKRILNWAKRERRIKENTLDGAIRPSETKRDTLLDADSHRQMIMAVRKGRNNAKIDRQFQLALIAIRHCGGRPQDIANARVEYVKSGGTTWQLPEHKNRRHTQKPKTVYLSPCLQTITKILSAGRENGPLFRGRKGALNVNSIGCRMKRLKKELNLPDGVVTNSYRHTYITDALERGVDIATVAELVGTSVTMIQRHCGHLEARGDHLSNAARKAVS